ncbi:hypothetical protein Cni_G22634 [Canna indica]|uniref:Uncharacterized protein n=1 Tax=Canna indica TaxID=4628 RepID=A0AAQ3KS59_9LILI|nr:hypothetical protein Cni_G22634 [Canna indica]
MNSVFLLPKPLAFAATSSPSLLVYQTCTPSSIIGAPKVNCAHRSNALRKSLLELRSPPRVWLDNCCQLLISSIFGLSCALSVHGAVAGVMYPCEDVDRYHSGVSGLEGAALMEKLSSIVSIHRSLRYKEVWDALKILDAADVENPEAASEIIEIYSLRAVPKSLAGKPEGWNREHLWPRSYGLTDGPALTDLYNIRPADANVNSSRGNKYYGECTAVSTHCVRPANNEAAPDTEADKESWAPPVQVRGDVARSLMYMAVSYGFQQPDGRPPLQLSDSPNIEKSEMGLLSTLLRWNKLDPPSKVEQLRNDRICKLYQHNRNPFIDHPEYANLIWKHATPGNTILPHPNSKAWINEFHYDNKGKDRNEFIEILLDPSIDAAKLELVFYNGSNGRMYKSLSLEDNQIFSVESDASGYRIFTAFTSLQNGPADSIALVSIRDEAHFEVPQFISYEGSLRAIDGPAKGMKSMDIMVHETDESTANDSLGLTGQEIGKFKWRQFKGDATPGKTNVGQRLQMPLHGQEQHDFASTTITTKF